jgi:hypothetical protein
VNFKALFGGGNAMQQQQAQYYQMPQRQQAMATPQPNWNQGGTQANWGNNVPNSPPVVSPPREYAPNPQAQAWAAALRDKSMASGAPDPNTWISGSQQQLLDNLMKNQQYRSRPEYSAQEKMLKGNALDEYRRRQAYMGRYQPDDPNKGNMDIVGAIFGATRGGGNRFNQKGYDQWVQKGAPLNMQAYNEVNKAQNPDQKGLGRFFGLMRGR